jgi:hypothetical protein
LKEINLVLIVIQTAMKKLFKPPQRTNNKDNLEEISKEFIERLAIRKSPFGKYSISHY